MTTELQQQHAPLWQGLLGPCVRGALWVALVTGLAYPLATTLVAKVLLPSQAAGSLIKQEQQVIGSRWIGQHFTDKAYFHGRPSVTSGPNPQDPSTSISLPYNAGASLGSNQGATHPALLEAVAQRTQEYRRLNGLAANAQVPVDAVTASASGLDPHISLANAELQVARVAKARNLPEAQVRALLQQHHEGRLLGLWGEPRVNVLLLNIALDALPSARQGEQHDEH